MKRILVSLCLLILATSHLVSIALATPHSIVVSAVSDRPDATTRELTARDNAGVMYVKKAALLTLSDLTHAEVVRNASGASNLRVQLSACAGRLMRAVSAINVGRRLAFMVDDQLISAPVIKVPLEGDGLEMGPLSQPLADEVAALINHQQ